MSEGLPDGSRLVEGFSVGSSEGLADGSTLVEGFSEGSSEGVSEGSSEGLTDGSRLVEGLSDGSSEGLSEGSSDGLTEELTEGSSDRLTDGSRLVEGLSDGSSEGLSEDSSDGLTDGSRLGEGLSEGSRLLTEGLVDGAKFRVLARIDEHLPHNLRHFLWTFFFRHIPVTFPCLKICLHDHFFLRSLNLPGLFMQRVGEGDAQDAQHFSFTFVS